MKIIVNQPQQVSIESVLKKQVPLLGIETKENKRYILGIIQSNDCESVLKVGWVSKNDLWDFAYSPSALLKYAISEVDKKLNRVVEFESMTEMAEWMLEK